MDFNLSASEIKQELGLIPKSTTLDVPLPNNNWSNQFLAALEEYCKHRDKSNDNEGVIRLVPLPEYKTTLRKTANGWEIIK